MSTDKLIIDNSELMSRLRTRTEWSVTLMGWAVWLLLFRPVFLAVLWYLGLRQLYLHMVVQGGAQGILDCLALYSAVIACIAVAVIAWNAYNRIRFKDKERRKQTPAVAEKDIAANLDIEPSHVRELKQSGLISVGFLDAGRITLTAETVPGIPAALNYQRP